MLRYKIFFTILMIGMTLLATHSTVMAASISFEPTTQDVTLGNPFAVSLVVSDLGNAAPSLSTFDIDIAFDPAFFSFSNAVFGDPVLGDQLDLFGLGSLTAADLIAPGLVNLFELSFDAPSDLNDLQADSFTLATVSFDTLAQGQSAVSFAVNQFGDADGVSLQVNILRSSVNVNVAATPVPEPNSTLLLAVSLAGVLGYGWWQKVKMQRTR